MTTDDVLNRDLAALALDGRDRVPPLDDLVAALDLAPRGPAPESRVRARRVAWHVGWIAGGTAAIGTTLVLLGACLLATASGADWIWRDHPLLVTFIGVSIYRVPIYVAVVGCIAGAIAWGIADARHARRHVRDELLVSVAGWALAAKIASLAVIVQLWGSMQLSTYWSTLWPIWDIGVWYALASPIAIACLALAIARSARRDTPPRWLRALESFATPLVALFVLALAFYVHYHLMHDVELALAGDLATRVVATLALVAASAWWALRVR